MTVTIRQVGPCFAGEVEGIDMRTPAHPGRGRGDPRRHGPVRRAGVPRPEDRRRPAARLHAEPGRDRARDRHQPARRQTRLACPRPSPTSPTSTRTTRPFAARRPPPAVRHRQPAVALRQLVQGDPGEVLAAARHQHPVQGRQHEFADMRAAYDALDDETKAEVEDMVCEHSQMFSRQQHRLHRLHRRGARALQAGAPVHGAHPSGDRRASRSTCRRMPAASSAGRCPRRAVTCAT